MSDDGYYDDDDDYAFLDDFSYNEADDLAEHTMPSPVLVNYDPAFETASLPSDWEYYSDDYWDHEPPKKGKRKEKNFEGVDDKGGEAANGRVETARKRRKPKCTGNVPLLTLGEPVLATPSVVWKAKTEILESHGRPISDKEHGEKVSLLQDWRKRFKLPHKASRSRGSQLQNPSIQRKGTQRVTAVLIDSTCLEHDGHTTTPSKTLSRAQSPPSRSKVLLSTAKKTPVALDKASCGGSLPDDLGHVSERNHFGKGAASEKRKRKAKDTSDSDRVEERLGEMKRPRVRGDARQSSRKSKEEPTRVGVEMGKENAPDAVNQIAPLRQKRKFLDSEDESVRLSAKRSKSTGKATTESVVVGSSRVSTRKSARKKPA